MKNKAFTLVELLAVIAIIGITSTFVLINTNKKKEEYSKISNDEIKEIIRVSTHSYIVSSEEISNKVKSSTSGYEIKLDDLIEKGYISDEKLKNFETNKDINTKINLDTNSSTKIKICGLTSPAEARYLNENHVDFAGMVLFFPKSKRNISIEQAKEIMAALDASIKRVAVVVSPSIEQVRQIEAAGFDYVQIHGEIPETEAEAAKAIPILKAFNVSDMDSYEKYHNDSRIAGYVFDAIEPGSGKTFDWKLVDNIPRDEKLLLLAGGLNPDNVRMAIEAVHPDGVDVSSGVENDDKAGKNPEKIHDFVAAIKS